MKWSKLTFAWLLASWLVSPAHAISHTGFESGDLTGWIWNGQGAAEVVTGHSAIDDPRSYSAMGGNYFARLTAGPIAGFYTTLSQTLTLNAGQTFSGWAAFDAADYLPYDDDAFVLMVGNDGVSTLWSASVTTVGDGSSSPWEAWSYTATTTGSYTFVFGVANSLDEDLSSIALFDIEGVSTVGVPDGGSTLIFLGANLLGFFAIGRRFFRPVTR